MKKILVVVLALGVLAVAAVLLLVGNLGAVIRAAVERFGSDATGTPVKLAEADVSLTDGRGSLRGLTIANPQGFKTPTAFSLGEITLEIDPASVTTDVVVIRRLAIGAPQVTYELDGSLRSNVAAIEDHVKAYAGGAGGEGHEGGKTGGKGGSGGGSASSSGPERRFIVDEFTVQGGKITVAAPVGGKVVTADMPEIRMRNLGRDRGGLTQEQLAAEIVKALTQSALEGAARGGLEGATRGVIDKAVDKVKGALDGLLKGKK